MANLKLLNEVSWDKLIQLGFIEEQDGSGDPRGTSYTFKNDKFIIVIDAWADVQIARVNPDTDYLNILIETMSELELLIAWVAD